MATVYSTISKVSTNWSKVGEIADYLLMENGFNLLLEDGFKIKIPANIWTNIPKA